MSTTASFEWKDGRLWVHLTTRHPYIDGVVDSFSRRSHALSDEEYAALLAAIAAPPPAQESR